MSQDCSYIWRVKNAPQFLVGRSMSLGRGVCLLLAGAVTVAGCTSGRHPSTSTVVKPPTSTSRVEHWGSFFGAKWGNFDMRLSPATVTLPGIATQVGSSNSTEYALTSDGKLYAWGLGTMGQLGDGGRVSSFIHPVQVRFPAGVKIAFIPTDVMPYDTGLAVDTHGNVWGWGLNGGGELCMGNTKLYTLPVELHLHDVTTLAGASNHGLYDSHGTVYACGQNVTGDLGDGSKRGSTTPVPVTGLHGATIVKLVASFANSGALTSTGQYYDWGTDVSGQLGNGRIGHMSDVPVRVHLPDAVTQLAQGGSIWNNGQTLVMLADGSLWSWGNNRAFQLGNQPKDPLSQPLPVRFSAPPGVTYRYLATGSATSYAISATGDVYAWGVSHVGQLGNGRKDTAKFPVLIATGATSISATANNVVINTPRRQDSGSL
jgi:alpha-tubulin suppressor-like RCC1 family protein